MPRYVGHRPDAPGWGGGRGLGPSRHDTGGKMPFGWCWAPCPRATNFHTIHTLPGPRNRLLSTEPPRDTGSRVLRGSAALMAGDPPLRGTVLEPSANSTSCTFSGGASTKTTKAGMAISNGVITADSWTRGAYCNAFNHAVERGWRRTLGIQPARPSVRLSPRGPAHAAATVARSVQESPPRRDILCSEDTARPLRRARDESGCVEASGQTIGVRVTKKTWRASRAGSTTSVSVG